MKAMYLVLAIMGAVVPYALFAPWLLEHGFNLRLMLCELFATPVGAFFGTDVLLSAVTLILFMRREGARLGMQGVWVPVVATCGIGVSCGLPLFLYLRERRLATAPA